MKVFIKELTGFEDLKCFYDDGTKMLYCDNAKMLKTFDENSDVYKKLLEVEKETNSYVVEFYDDKPSYIVRKHDIFKGYDYVFPLENYIELEDNRIVILWYAFDKYRDYSISDGVQSQYEDIKREYKAELEEGYSDAKYKLEHFWDFYFKEYIVENFNSFSRSLFRYITNSNLKKKLLSENILDLSEYPDIYGMVYELPKVKSDK